MYTALKLSKYIVSKCIKEEKFISNLHLQKILYFIQKDFLQRGKIAFNDDIEAWQFGPVVPNVYYYFCGFGSMPISNLAGTFLIEEDKDAIDRIVEAKRELDPWDMVSETHRAGGAWAQVYNNGLGIRQVIPTELIKSEG